MLDNFLQLLGSFPSGVQTANQTAHAGSRDVIDGNVMIFKPLQDTDVGQAKGTTAFEGDADLCAGWFGLRDGGGSGGCRGFLCDGQIRHEEEQQKWQCDEHRPVHRTSWRRGGACELGSLDFTGNDESVLSIQGE